MHQQNITFILATTRIFLFIYTNGTVVHIWQWPDDVHIMFEIKYPPAQVSRARNL